jgi:4-carboxymuconolactone decarboxylase
VIMDQTKSDNHRKGLNLFNRPDGGNAGEQLVNNLADVSPDLVNMTIEWAMHGIMERPGLDL